MQYNEFNFNILTKIWVDVVHEHIKRFVRF